MSDTEEVYQIRKVFDPASFGVIEELVSTGTVKVSDDSEKDEAVAVPEKAKKEATKKPAKKTKRTLRKKNEDA